MTEVHLKERESLAARRPYRGPRPKASGTPRIVYWRRVQRVHGEHWLIAALLLAAFANAVRLLAFD
ncbi:MAG TPA: hypothetical protein VEB68_14325 [Croceibacterium sp.]|nr:hypothetical protein [Croceibacterium sp.]